MQTNNLEKLAQIPRPMVVRGLVGVVLLFVGVWLLYIELAHAETELRKWSLIADDLDCSLPSGVVKVQKIATATGYWPLVVFAVVGSLSLSLALKKERSKAFLLWCCILFLVVFGTSRVIVSQLQFLDPWLASEMDVSLPLTVEQVPANLDVLLSRAQPVSERILAARTIRTIGLKHAAGLLRIDESLTRRLIQLAADQSTDPKIRFFAVFALFPIDHSSDSSRRAISGAIHAASLSEDSQLRDMAIPYQTLPGLQYETTVTVTPRPELLPALQIPNEEGVTPDHSHAFDVTGGVFLVHVMNYDDRRDQRNDSTGPENVRVVDGYIVLPFPNPAHHEVQLTAPPDKSVLFLLQVFPTGMRLHIQQTSRFANADGDATQSVYSSFHSHLVSWRRPEDRRVPEHPVLISDFLAAHQAPMMYRSPCAGFSAHCLQVPQAIHATEIQVIDHFQIIKGHLAIAVEHLPLDATTTSEKLQKRWDELCALANETPQDATLRYYAVWTALLLAQRSEQHAEQQTRLTKAQRLLEEAMHLEPANFALRATGRRLTLTHLQFASDPLTAQAFCQQLLSQRPSTDECELAAQMLLDKLPKSQPISPRVEETVVAAVRMSLKLCSEWVTDRRRRIQQWKRYLEDERPVAGLETILRENSE